MAKKPTTNKSAEATTEGVEAFKGFDKNLACRGYQYEVSKTFEHKGRVDACSSGFHVCENPFDVLSYYPLLDGDAKPSRFARVTVSGALSRHTADSKIAAGILTVNVELKLPDFIQAAVDWIVAAKKVAPSTKAPCSLTDKGDDGAQIGSSGNDAQIGSSGYGARIGSSGNGAQIGSSGNDAQIGSSGYGARIGSSGNGAQIGSSGNGARINSSGARAVVASAGINAIAMGAIGAWLSLAEFEYSDGEWRCVGFATGCIGQDGLKPDTFYRAKGGKLVEAV